MAPFNAGASTTMSVEPGMHDANILFYAWSFDIF